MTSPKDKKPEKNICPACRKILLGSNNPKKLQELIDILSGMNIQILSPRDIRISLNVIEDGATFEENACKKALAFAQGSGLYAVADDSGLEVEALAGLPGVYSARYASANGDDKKNIAKLLREMKDIPEEKRQARFRSCIAFAHPKKGILFTVEGEVKGIILKEPRGESGFGYDPVFFYPPAGKTFAEMVPSEKNKISHRYQALVKFKEKLKGYF